MKLHLHGPAGTKIIAVSSGLRRRTKDSPELAAAYEELVQSLLDFIAQDKKQRAKGGDEEFGHEFHGNQYVEVAGQGKEEPKPKPTKASNPNAPAKHQIHELLSSGHAFSVEELMQATGHANKSTITSWLSMFKSQKTAGSKGVLHVQKLPNGQYQVMKGDAPAPAMPKAEEPKKEVPAEAPGSPQELPKEVAPAQASPPVAKPPATGKVSKEYADAFYSANIHEAAGGLKKAVAGGAPVKEALLDFKKNKAMAMAQWAANIQGQPMAAKIPEAVFQADEQLAKNLSSGMVIGAALKKWKEDTAHEKAGSFKPYEPGAPKEVPKPAPVVEKKNQLTHHPDHSLDAPKSLRPDGHVDIDHADFEGPSGGAYGKGMRSLKSQLEQGSAGSVGNKVEVEKHLQTHLQHSASWQALKSKFPKGKMYGLEGTMIQAWAGSSGDHQPKSVASQLAIRDAFGIHPDDTETAAFRLLDSIKKQQGGTATRETIELEAYRQAYASVFESSPTPQDLETFKAGLRDFALAQHKATQAFFKERGITHVYLTRGMKIPYNPAAGPARKVNLKLQPASSFSCNLGTASNFGSGGSLFAAKVPVEQVLSTYRTGYGCSNEHEVVVLAHKDLEVVQTGTASTAGIEGFAAKVMQSQGKDATKAKTAGLTQYKAAQAMVPKKPYEAKHASAKLAYAAAVKGDVAKVKQHLTELQELAKAGTKLPASTKYVESLVAHAEKVAATPKGKKVKSGDSAFITGSML